MKVSLSSIEYEDLKKAKVYETSTICLASISWDNERELFGIISIDFKKFLSSVQVVGKANSVTWWIDYLNVVNLEEIIPTTAFESST